MNGTTITGIPISTGEKRSAGSSLLGKRGARRLLIIGGALLIAAIVAGVWPRLSQRRQATADTQQLALQSVTVVSASVSAPPDGLMLPAEIKPWQEASIFSRVNGYLKSWAVDIGAHVEPDQALAEVDTPDLDHQLEQARSQAALAQKVPSWRKSRTPNSSSYSKKALSPSSTPRTQPAQKIRQRPTLMRLPPIFEFWSSRSHLNGSRRRSPAPSQCATRMSAT